MAECRLCTKGHKEHLSSIRDSDYNDDKKYAFMLRHGGPGAWIFVPYIFSHAPIPKQILLTLESQEIQLHPKHLNKEQRHKQTMVKKGRPVNPAHAARAALLPRANSNNRGETPVRLQLMHGSGLTPDVVATDLESAASSAQSLLVHASLLQLASRVAILRALGKSEVHCMQSDTGEQVVGSPRSALRWELHGKGWFEIRLILKVRRTMVHDAEYEELLWIVSHKLPGTFMFTNLSVDSLWRCWLMHQLGVHIHKQNVEQLRQVLRRKGFTLTRWLSESQVVLITADAL